MSPLKHIEGDPLLKAAVTLAASKGDITTWTGWISFFHFYHTELKCWLQAELGILYSLGGNLLTPIAITIFTSTDNQYISHPLALSLLQKQRQFSRCSSGFHLPQLGRFERCTNRRLLKRQATGLGIQMLLVLADVARTQHLIRLDPAGRFSVGWRGWNLDYVMSRWRLSPVSSCAICSEPERTTQT